MWLDDQNRGKRDVCEMYDCTTVDDGCGVYLAAYYDLHKRVTLYINGPKIARRNVLILDHAPSLGLVNY